MNALRRNTLLAILLGVLVVKGSSPCRGDEPTTEVVVIATRHFLTDMPVGYTPGHLRALIAKIKPTVLAVEAPVNTPAPWQHAPYELWNVTRPWAQQHKIKTEPIGWLQADYQTQLQAMFQQFAATNRLVEYQKIEQEFQKRSATNTLTCRFLNSDVNHQLWREYHAGLSRLAGGETPWQAWNRRIADNAIALLKKHPGERVAIVFGAAHGYYLIDALSQSKGVKLLSAGSFLPLSKEEVADHTTPIDYLKALRLLNFDAVSPQQLARVKLHLDVVGKNPDLKNDHALFLGKYHLHAGDPTAAFAEFDRLAALSSDAVSKFDGVSRLKETGAVFAAIALHQSGDNSLARERLEEAIADESTTAPTKQWARGVRAALPTE